MVFSTHEAVKNAPKTFDQDAHHQIARKCAEESIVLLDNDGILPLAEGASVAVIGDFAKIPRYQGAGSSQVNPTKLDNLYDCLTGLVNITGYAQGYDRKNPNREPRSGRVTQQELDNLLDKISREGINSLSEEEMKRLELAREQMRGGK